MLIRVLFLAITFFALTACQCPSSLDSERTPVSYDDLPGWSQDSVTDCLPALQKTCSLKLKKSGEKDWWPFCQAIQATKEPSDENLRKIVKKFLQPYRVSCYNESVGTFTGYYEPVLRGSRRRHGAYRIPLYRMPTKGYRVPRHKIVTGALKGRGLEIVWVNDATDAFFLQIQGSGQVMLDNGQTIRLGYAGQNGFPYFAIGRALVDRGYLDSGDVSMQSIKKWLKKNPSRAESIMSLNRSYVFFKEVQQGPVGSHGVVLTPGRSLAIDRDHVSLGTPMWVHLKTIPGQDRPLTRLMVAQDTGGAIKGPVRGDVFWGSGSQAADLAGHMNTKGEYYVLLPSD